MIASSWPLKALHPLMMLLGEMPSHCLFTKVLRASILGWQTVQALASICPQNVKSRGLASGEYEGQNSLGQNGMLASNHSWAFLEVWVEVPSCWKTMIMSG